MNIFSMNNLGLFRMSKFFEWILYQKNWMNYWMNNNVRYLNEYFLLMNNLGFLDTQVSLAPTHVSKLVRWSVTLSDFKSLVALLCNSRLWWPHSNASGVPTIPKEVDTITKEVNTLTKEVNTLTKEVDTITKLFSKL